TRCLSDWSSDVCSSDLLWAERFLRNEFALFCQQTDSHAQERDQILRGLYDVQTRQPATPVVIVRIQELCFLPGVILPWVTAHARSEERRVGKERRWRWW